MDSYGGRGKIRTMMVVGNYNYRADTDKYRGIRPTMGGLGQHGALGVSGCQKVGHRCSKYPSLHAEQVARDLRGVGASNDSE